MKQRGMYLARQLSFQDVLYNMYDEVCLDRKFIKVYDNSVELWVDVQQSFIKAEQLQTMDPEAHKALWFNFWAAHYDFFKHLCISAKVLNDAAIAIIINMVIKSFYSIKFFFCLIVSMR